MSTPGLESDTAFDALGDLKNRGAPTAYEYVRATLRAAVLDGRLRGGTRLLQTDLSRQLGVSTTPVREALRDLASEGLVVLDARRGALVRSLDMAEVRELYELRQALEPIMVRRVVPGVGEAQLDRAHGLQQQMDQPASPSDWSELNRQFHATLYEQNRSSRLASILAGLRDSAAPFVALSLCTRPEQMRDSNAEHAEMVRLYRRGEVEEAVVLTARHLAATLAVIEEAHARGDI